MPRLRRTVLASLAVPVLAAGAATAAAAARTPAAGPAVPSVARPAHGRLVVKADEFEFGPAAIAAKAGRLRITLRNAGGVEHELVLLRTDRPAASLRTKHGRVSEAASVGEISETRPGAAGSHTFGPEARPVRDGLQPPSALRAGDARPARRSLGASRAGRGGRRLDAAGAHLLGPIEMAAGRAPFRCGVG